MIRESSTPKLTGRLAALALALAVFALMPARTSSASMLQIIPQTATLAPGQSTTVSVLFTSSVAFTLQSTDLAIAYDSTRFSVSNVQLGTLDPGPANGNPGFSQSVGMPSSGIPGIGELTTSAFFVASGTTIGNPITPGQSGTLETFTLTALANAPAGGATGDINLQMQFGNTFTAVDADANGNDIVLSPPPTNGYDPGVDATITVGATVPEPSSILLMGLGGGFVTVTTLFRKRKARRAPAAA